MCFEITETAAPSRILGNVVYFMRELKTRGCHFALDDFGSGLSSFMYLKTLPVDYLKIDGQFLIENVTRDPVDRSMVEAISQVGKAMGIHTIAERVESLEVLQELGRLGIGFAQGFHIAEPKSTSGISLSFGIEAPAPSQRFSPRPRHGVKRHKWRRHSGCSVEIIGSRRDCCTRGPGRRRTWILAISGGEAGTGRATVPTVSGTSARLPLVGALMQYIQLQLRDPGGIGVVAQAQAYGFGIAGPVVVAGSIEV